MRLIEIVSKNKKQNQNFRVEDLLEPFSKVFISKEIRLKCPNELKTVLEELKNHINDTLFDSKN